jgi:DNA-binding NtrC family response regulator
MNFKVLVVDRRSVERSELTLPLKKAGVGKIAEANLHELAAQPFQAGQYDAVFVEFNTLMEAGQALARSLRAMDADVPIVVTYPLTTRIADIKKYCPQASAYLASPFTSDQLWDTLQECVSAATN